MWNGCGFVFFVWNMYCSCICFVNFLKFCKSWCLILFLFVIGVGINLSFFEIMLIWLLVSWRLERFLMNFLFDFFCVVICFWVKYVWCCLCFMFVLNFVFFWGFFMVVWFLGKRFLYFLIFLLFVDVCNICVYNICLSLLKFCCNFLILFIL